MKKQLLEAEFILICRNLYKKTLDIMDVLYFAEAICQLDHSFSELRVKKVIQKAFSGDCTIPTTQQWVVVLLKNNYTVPQIQKNVEVSRQTVYNIKITFCLQFTKCITIFISANLQFWLCVSSNFVKNKKYYEIKN